MQDLPPVGGYDSVQWKRNVPSRGFRPTTYLAGLMGIMSYGFYLYYKGNDERRELQREKLWSRFYIQPLLLAEEDRNVVRRYFANAKREAEIMGNREWNPDYVYYSTGELQLPKYSYLTSSVKDESYFAKNSK